MQVSAALKALRVRAGLSVRQLAAALARPASSYASYEQRYKREFLPAELVRALVPIFEERGIPRAEVLALAGLTTDLAPASSGENVNRALASEAQLSRVETTGWPIDIPVVRVELAAGGDGFLLENTVIDRLPRPPGIRSAVNIYAFYVVDDSMSPRFEPGDPVYVSPDRPPVPGCDILIELQTDDGAPRSMIRRLISRKRTGLTLRRFNPDTTDLVPLDRIRRVHRILSLRELAGA